MGLAFGPAAERWLNAYAELCPTLAVEPEGAVAAYAAAIDLRAEGTSFDLALFWPDRRTHVAIAVAAQSMVDFADYDKRRFALEAIGRGKGEIKGQPIESLLAVDIATMTAMRDLVLLADRLLVRSWTEWRRIVFEMGLLVPNVLLVEVPDPSVPRVERGEPDGSVVVWAPFTPLPKLGIVVMALSELNRRVVYVCADGAIAGADVERCASAGAAQALSRASAVVVADNDDPAPARALASLGIPLCVASTSGAREYVARAQTFRPWHRKSILGATLAALGSEAAGKRVAAVATGQGSVRVPAVVAEPPLVSIVVRTHDRPSRLERALKSIARQRYPNVETIVVNGTGPDVESVVQRFRNARLVTQPRPDPRKMTNAGMRAAKGTYVARLDDDDLYFPEHVERLVEALESRRESVAFSDAAVAYVEGPQVTVAGYLVAEREAVSRSSMLASNQLIAPMLRMLLRRDALERVGWFSESIRLADDYELCLRLLEVFDFVHVDRVTAMHTRYGDERNRSHSTGGSIADAYRLIHVLHPVEGRPHLIASRANVIEHLDRHGRFDVRRPPWRFSHRVGLPGYAAEEPSRLTT